MTKYVISGYIGFDNFGDEAIAKVLTEHLKKIGAEKITYISSNPQKTATLYDVHSVGMFNFVKPILESDVLISGGGSLLQDITSLKSLIYYLAIISTALILRKKVVIFAQGFTPFRTKIGENLSALILRHCHEITVRDKKSQEYLKRLGITSKLVSDPVFNLKTPKSTKKEIVGIQLRADKHLNDNFLENLADEVSKKFSDKEIQIISLQDSFDYEISKKFKKILKKRNIKTKVKNNLSIKKALKKFSELEYLIGMRFHACLIGAKSGAKVLGINYDEKVKKLSNDIGFPCVELNETNFEQKFDKLLNIDPKDYNIPKFSFEDITFFHSPNGH